MRNDLLAFLRSIPKKGERCTLLTAGQRSGSESAEVSLTLAQMLMLGQRSTRQMTKPKIEERPCD